MTKPMKGRGGLVHLHNRFLATQPAIMHHEAIDDWETPAPATQFLEEHAKTLVNKVDSPDVGMVYSMNPYQGCEHGCTYCYARNTHEYWGYNAGLDFEQKIIVKKNAPQLLKRFLEHPSWQPQPISLSGNTDCYQPAEQRFRLTRRLLEVCEQYGQPVSIITKNSYILHDADLLQRMASRGLAMVMVTITTQNETLRRSMEPRTTTAAQRLRVISDLSAAGVPTGVMLGPVIPAINDHEMAEILQHAAAAGACTAGYTFIRLNGSVQLNFKAWLYAQYPDRADKVWNMISDAHGGQVSDSQFGRRMRGEGVVADMINQQFKKHCKRLGLNKEKVVLDTSHFGAPGRQLNLF